MKKKSRKTILTALLFLLLAFSITMPVQAKKRTASTVTSKTSYKNDKEFMTVRGLDKQKKVVWKYVTSKYPATELAQTKCVVRKNRVYVFENSKVMALRKKDGKCLWTSSPISPAGHVIRFDEDNNLYVTGYYDTTIYKVSPKGKILWKKSISRTGNYWPYKITISGNKVTILYEMNSKDSSSQKKHKVILNVKNGKLIKYS